MLLSVPQNVVHLHLFDHTPFCGHAYFEPNSTLTGQFVISSASSLVFLSMHGSYLSRRRDLPALQLPQLETLIIGDIIEWTSIPPKHWHMPKMRALRFRRVAYCASSDVASFPASRFTNLGLGGGVMYTVGHRGPATYQEQLAFASLCLSLEHLVFHLPSKRYSPLDTNRTRLRESDFFARAIKFVDIVVKDLTRLPLRVPSRYNLYLGLEPRTLSGPGLVGLGSILSLFTRSIRRTIVTAPYYGFLWNQGQRNC